MTDRPQQPFELTTQRLGALPIVDHFLERIGVRGLLERHLPAGDRRVMLPAAVAIGLLVRNLCVAREPLYGLAEWAERHHPGLLGLVESETGLLNDDRVGRALDQLFDADRGSLLCELMLGVIKEFRVDCSQLHNDSTSITVHGDYTAADGHARAGKPTGRSRWRTACWTATRATIRRTSRPGTGCARWWATRASSTSLTASSPPASR